MKRIIAILLVLLTVAMLCACGASKKAGQKTVGIAMPNKTTERWNRDGNYLKEQFEKAGYHVILKYSDNKTEQQNNDIANMIADGLDLLIIACIDADSLTQTLKDATCPVIAYDRCINAPNVKYYVTFDNYMVGVLMARYVADKLNADNTDGPYHIELVSGDPADTNAHYIYRGAMDVLQPYLDSGKFEILSGQTTFEQTAVPQWSTDKAFDRFQNILASYYLEGTVLDGVVSASDDVTLGTVQAITSGYAGGNKPVVTGQDASIASLQSIVDGGQTMTLFKNFTNQATVTFALGEAILKGKAVDASLCETFSVETAYDTETYSNGESKLTSFLLAPTIVDGDNLDALTETGLYKWDADHKYLETSN